MVGLGNIPILNTTSVYGHRVGKEKFNTSPHPLTNCQGL